MWALLIALICGGLLPLAFAPINIYSFAFFMPAILLVLWLRSTPIKAFWLGLTFGIGFFGVGSSWVYISIHNFGNANILLASIMTALLILLMSLYPAVQGYILRKLWRNHSDMLICLCVFPATWVLCEYIRSFLFDGFPFLFLGYSQTSNALAAYAPIVGVYGLSLIVAFISGALALLTRPVAASRKYLAVVVIIGFVGIAFGYHNHRWTHPNSKPIQISLVQGNISQQIKWDPQELTTIINKYHHLTKAHWSSRIIIWPEAAVPFIPSQLPKFFSDLSLEAKKNHTTVVVGAPLQGPSADIYYNGLTLFGTSQGQYLKRHLVPYGEFTPLKSLLEPIINNINSQLFALHAV